MAYGLLEDAEDVVVADDGVVLTTELDVVAAVHGEQDLVADLQKKKPRDGGEDVSQKREARGRSRTDGTHAAARVRAGMAKMTERGAWARTATLMDISSPSLVRAPGPTLTTSASLIFLSAAPGRMMPPADFSSATPRFTSTRSARGLNERQHGR